MKCVEIDGVKSLKVVEREEPSHIDGRVVFKVNACGICGSDIHYYEMGNPKGLVMGHEFSGVVTDNGGRGDLSVGDRITALPISPCGVCPSCKSGNVQYCTQTWKYATGLCLEYNGAYAQMSSCLSNMVRKIPDSITDEEACMIEPTSVSLHAVKLANIMVGDKVCIVGGGVIGLLAAELAKMEGASYVCLLETNKKRGSKSLKYGYVDEYFDPSLSDTVSILKEKTNGGFDKVIECCGNSNAVSESIMVCKNGGTIVLVGVSMTPVTIPTVISVMGEIDMKGSIAYTELDFDRTIELISSKKINTSKYIDDVVKLEDANFAFNRLTSGENEEIKIIFKPNN